jgi:hypothetical protein
MMVDRPYLRPIDWAQTAREGERQMKRIGMIGTFVVLAIVAMALGSVSSAMAEDTALCLKNEPKCSAGNQVKRVHWVSTSSQLLTNLTNVSCTEVLLVWEVLQLGAPQSIHTVEAVYTNCKTSAETSCIVTDNPLPLFDLLKEGTNLGKATELSEQVTYKCGLLLNCTYGGSVIMHVWGTGGSKGLGEAPLLSASKLKLTPIEGSMCPKESFLDVSYTALEDFWITS